MPITVTERLAVPALVWALVALMSAGFIRAIGGASPRMRIVAKCFVVFIGGVYYCIAWSDRLGDVFGWEDAWMGVLALLAVCCVCLCRILLKRQRETRTERG
jgi:hypothetical protein